MQYQVVISYGFANGMLKSGAASDMESALNAAGVGPVTAALFMFPVGSAIAQLFVGFLADWIGRKGSAIFMSVLTLTSFILMTVGSNLGWSPYLVGVCCGAAVGGFYGTTDIDVILVSESSPTNLRSSILSAQFLAMGVGYVVTYAVGLPLITVLGNGKVPAISLCLAVPGMFLSLVVKMTRVHETKGVDLDKITGTEWD